MFISYFLDSLKRLASKIFFGFLYGAGGIILLLLVLLLLLRLPVFQQFITKKATAFVSGKTKTRIEIDRLYVGFPKSIVLEGVFSEDLNRDTLLYLQQLEIDVALWDLLDNKLSISSFELEGLTANIKRTLPDSSFNFDFFIKAFVKSQPNETKAEADTAAGNFVVQIEKVHLQRIKLLYDDAVSGMYAKANIGNLELSMKEIDLENMRFKADELLLANTDGVFEIRKQAAPSPPSASGSLPAFGMKKLTLNQVNFGFHNLPDSSFFDFKVDQLELEPKAIDLNKQWVDVEKVLLHNSDIRISIKQQPQEKDTAPETAGASNNWKAAISEIDLENNHFSFQVNNVPKQRSGIDYKHLDAKNINLKANQLLYSPNLIRGNIDQLALTESCGLNLKNFKTQFVYDSAHAELKDVLIETDKTRISNYLFASYTSIESLAQDIGNLRLDVNLNNSKISMQDVLQFAPDLIQQPIIKQNRHQIMSIDGQLKGLVNDLLVQKLDIRMAGNTHLALNGTLKGLPDANKLFVDVEINTLATSRFDLENMLPKSMLPSIVRLPDGLHIHGNAKGTLTNMATKLNLNSSDGTANLSGKYTEQAGVPYFDVALDLHKLNVGRILKQTTMLGSISASFTASGHTFDPEKMIAELTGEIQQIDLQHYTYKNIEILATANQSRYAGNVSIDDKNLSLNLDAVASLRKDSAFASMRLNLKNADFKGLNLYKTNLAISTNMHVEVQDFDLQKMDARLSIKNLLVKIDDQKIAFDSLVGSMENDIGRHLILVKSDLLDMDFKGSHSIDQLLPSIQHYLDKKLGNPSKNPVLIGAEFTCNLELKPHRVFKDVFVPELTAFKGLKMEADFSQSKQTLNLKASSEFIHYGENKLKEFLLDVNANEDNVAYSASLRNIESGSISLPETTLKGGLKNKIIEFGLNVVHPDSGKRLEMHGSVNQQVAGETAIRLTGGSLIIENQTWIFDENNLIKILPKGINIQKFGLAQEGQHIRVQSTNEKPNAPIDIHFQHFEIGSISKIIEKDTALVRGLIDGVVHVRTIDPLGFTADLGISNIAIMEVPVGNLKITANNLVADRYSALVVLSGDSNNVRLEGYYENEMVDLNLDIQQLYLKSFEAFAAKVINNSSGHLTGKLAIKGKATEPTVNGTLGFRKAGFNLVAINNRLLMENENMKLDNKGVHFNNFTILDSDRQQLQVNGSVLSSNFKEMTYALNISTKNFTVLHTTAKDNPAYYGTMTLNSTIQIRGNQNLPIVTANAQLLEGSNFTFVVLEGDLNTSRGESVVVFEDSASLANKAPKDTSVVMKSEFKGIDLTANIEVNKKSVFRVIVDPNSGDNLEVSGDANLAFSIDQSGKMSLSGVYTLNDGHYQASFQKVLKREFKMKAGSRISWSGDPMDGQIDLTATYITQAPPNDLLAAELTGMGENERAAYRKLLTFYVNLKVEGPILKPQLSFNLDMLPADQLSFGGIVYNKINLLNTDPNELNKQVFSLLVLNKFLPSGSGGGGPSGGEAVSTIARNSVNQMLSDQLNALSGKYVKGADLNFNLRTTEDYAGGTAEQNTALQVGLKKELFNSRLSLQIGSSIDLNGGNQNSAANGQSLTGDVLVEYKLTEDGRYRLKAFRENQFEGVIDGILYRTGLGISFTQNYNHWSELRKALGRLKEEEPSPKTEK